MSTDLIKETTAGLAIANQQPNLTNNLNVRENHGIVNGNVERQIFINNSSTPTHKTVDPACCNIFVLRGKNFTGGCFSILKSRAYTNGINLSKTIAFPSLFIKTNNDYLRCADVNQVFYYGFVTAIEDEGYSYKVCYELHSTAPLLQADLNDLAIKLKITPIKGADVFDQTGWRVCQLDIVKALTENGFNMFVYA
jgi:hypothetical protein